MNAHEQINDLLPQYAAGSLPEDERIQVERHLPACAQCQADLAFWQEIGSEVAAESRLVHAPAGIADRALRKARPLVRRSGRRSLRWMLDLLRVQVTLVRSEIWPASTIVIAMGCIVAWIGKSSAFMNVLTPLVAAACLATVYGPANDPGVELAVATPTSPRQILLARVALVYGFNLALTVAAGLVVYPLLPVQPLGALLLNWLAPMTFLSALGLLLSLWLGPGNAVAATYGGWLIKVFSSESIHAPEINPIFRTMIDAYGAFWANPLLLLALALVAFLLAVWKADRKDLHLPEWA